jgi:hypothetical protein
MLLTDRRKIYSQEEIGMIENDLLQQIMRCGTPDAVEACITYARFLSLTGITNENYPLFIRLLEVGNHWVIDGLIGERDPFLFMSSIQPNYNILESCFKILTEKHPGELYPKSLSVILGVLQATYNVPEDGYHIYALSIYDLNTLSKHLNEDIGQEDSLNRVILDILHKIAQLKGQLGSEGLTGEARDKEELAIHANEVMSHFYDDTKRLFQVIPQVLLIKKDYRTNEIQPRAEVRFEDSVIYDLESMTEDPYAAVSDEEYEEEVYEEEVYEDEEISDPEQNLEPDPA